MIRDICIIVNIHNITQPQLFYQLASLPSNERAAKSRCALAELFYTEEKSTDETIIHQEARFNFNDNEIKNISYRVKINAKTHSNTFNKMQSMDKNVRSEVIIFALREYYNLNAQSQYTPTPTNGTIENIHQQIVSPENQALSDIGSLKQLIS